MPSTYQHKSFFSLGNFPIQEKFQCKFFFNANIYFPIQENFQFKKLKSECSHFFNSIKFSMQIYFS